MPVNKSKKQLAMDFLQMVVSGEIRKAYDQYVSQDFKHHNPYFKGDRETLLVAMEESHKQFPHKTFVTYRAFEEGDLVALHSSMHLQPGAKPIAVVHMFRFEGDMIVEEWEVGQQIPDEMPNENGIF